MSSHHFVKEQQEPGLLILKTPIIFTFPDLLSYWNGFPLYVVKPRKTVLKIHKLGNYK